MKHLPFILLYSRLVFAACNIVLALFSAQHAPVIVSWLIVAALLTDIFDGISARMLGVSTERLRALDSKVDTAFWLSVVFSLCVLCMDFMVSHIAYIIALVVSEILCQTCAFLKFRRMLALHAYLAKAWAILIAISCISVLTGTGGQAWFFAMFGWGLLAQAETLLIIAVLPEWHSDVPGLYHALRIRKKQPVKRYKLFNG